MTRRRALAAGLLSLAATVVAVPGLARAAAGPAVTVWKAASCECCEGWVRHMREAGFGVTVRVVDDVDPVKRANGVPDALASCHTALVDGYVVEGHVPASDVKRLLSERPQAKGLSAPGMPQDAPGMDMGTGRPYEVVLFGGAGGDRLFARH
ncbi:DUF411 domain-containing protein [Azospirillum doebereinerae]|uniref:DUF411 domain-containing protein n=1 Tax=Azospirillum doebereinerae TaxID=92933 RepID=UPI001EE53F87|nr:DUF411 domain-containing protein [Azospirillum doebereinerae]MCG5238481.1 DUF411 domain-containing protein [Azospirillum doebereinerae]